MMPTDDVQKSVCWDASSYSDVFLVLKRKERTVKGDWCNLAKDPLMVNSIFSLEHKDGKLWIVELTLGECDLILL